MSLPLDRNHEPIPALRPGPNQQVSVGAASATPASTPTTNVVRLCADVDCRYAVGSSPTASSTSPRLPSNVVEYIALQPGETVAAIQTGSAGTLDITEMS